MAKSKETIRAEQNEWRRYMTSEERAIFAQGQQERMAERQNLEVHFNEVFQQRAAWTEHQLEEAVATQRSGWETVVRSEAESSQLQVRYLQERFSELNNQQNQKLQALEGMVSNAEVRDRLQIENMSRLHAESTEYACLLRNTESGSFEESAAFYRYVEAQRNQILTYQQEAAEARSIAHEAVSRVRATEESMKITSPTKMSSGT